MEIPLYIIDTFTDQLFSGNPAAVCPLSHWLDDHYLQSIAAENNLSETAFFVKEGDIYQLRWFTPALEVDLCGHATLASAYVLFHYLQYKDKKIVFMTRSGQLEVIQEGQSMTMNFPSRTSETISPSPSLIQGLGRKPDEVLQAPQTYLAVFENETEIISIQPDFNLLANLEENYVIITAQGTRVDFVSRFFAPKVGVCEDPVTGSAHSTLIPYWANKLNKTSLTATQVSKRGGKLYCKYLGDRVNISGKAVTYAIGTIFLDLPMKS